MRSEPLSQVAVPCRRPGYGYNYLSTLKPLRKW